MFDILFGALIMLAVLLFVDEKVALGWHRAIRRFVKKQLGKIQD